MARREGLAYLSLHMDETTVAAWEFDPACDLGDVVRLAMEHLAPPSFVGRVLSTRGDALTLQVIEGSPSDDPRSLYYVGGHGAFVLARREEWPPRTGSDRKRLLLILLAFPQPTVAARSAP
jgi:hypothetical protein